jgi:hypothetical protein
MLPVVVDQLNHALQDFSPAEVATLTKLLRRMTARLDGTATAGVAAAHRVRKP